MINTKKVLLTICVILIPSIAITSSVYLILKGREEVKGVSVSVQRCVPEITNMIPNVAYVGQEYYFIPNIVNCGENEIDLSIEGVDWLRLTGDNYVYGIPLVSDVGVHKLRVVVRGNDGESELVDYIIVKENE